MQADRDGAGLSLGARMGWLAHALKAATQQHHLELREAFRPHIHADAVVFDVGAHAGQFSKLFAAMAPRGQVFAFEPSGYARSILGPALRWNRVRNVEIVPYGLSDADGTSVLHTPIKRRGQLGYGLAHLGDDTGTRATNDQTIHLTTMDGFVAERGLNRLDFIKADVEGWELNMLKGGVGALTVFRPVLFLEVVASSLARAGAAPADIWAQLEPLGYHAAKAPDFQPVGAFAGDGDYLFIAEHP
jgi:FkbM family methyltransferase